MNLLQNVGYLCGSFKAGWFQVQNGDIIVYTRISGHQSSEAMCELAFATHASPLPSTHLGNPPKDTLKNRVGKTNSWML